MTEAYDRAEVERLGDELPRRGPLCPRCEAHVPRFADLDREEERRIRELARKNRMMMAMEALRAATGCSEAWAKIWVLHRGGPPSPVDPPPPGCPHCGKPLRTAMAKQCRHCHRDWHDE